MAVVVGFVVADALLTALALCLANCDLISASSRRRVDRSVSTDGWLLLMLVLLLVVVGVAGARFITVGGGGPAWAAELLLAVGVVGGLLEPILRRRFSSLLSFFRPGALDMERKLFTLSLSVSLPLVVSSGFLLALCSACFFAR